MLSSHEQHKRLVTGCDILYTIRNISLYTGDRWLRYNMCRPNESTIVTCKVLLDRSVQFRTLFFVTCLLIYSGAVICIFIFLVTLI